MSRKKLLVSLTPLEYNALCLVTAQTADSLSGAIRRLIRDGLKYRAFGEHPDVIALKALERIEGRNGEHQC